MGRTAACAYRADPKTTPPVSEEDIKAHVLSYSEKGMISKFAVPQKILFVEALAKTSVGKFDKKALRAQYAVNEGEATLPFVRSHRPHP
jgi:acyl-CoA synthetase (AMP-forming)/AMP-acid ligase II